MTEADAPNAGWIEHWIQTQRQFLQRTAHAATESAAQAQGSASWRDVLTQTSAQTRETAERLMEIGAQYVAGLMQIQRQAQEHGAQDEHAPGACSTTDLLELWANLGMSAAGLMESGVAGAVLRTGERLTSLPPIGLAREHILRQQALNAAATECQRLLQEMSVTWAGLQSQALDLLEARLKERNTGGKPLGSYRELYDLWIEASEECYAKLAHSDVFAKLQAELGAAFLHLRAAEQGIAEQLLKQLDLPTRAELNTVHKQLRSLRERIEALESRDSPPAQTHSGRGARKSARERS